MKSLPSYANPGNELIRSLPVLNKIIIVMGILSMSIVIKPIEKKIINNYSAQRGVFFSNFYKREFDLRWEGKVITKN